MAEYTSTEWDVLIGVDDITDDVVSVTYTPNGSQTITKTLDGGQRTGAPSYERGYEVVVIMDSTTGSGYEQLLTAARAGTTLSMSMRPEGTASGSPQHAFSAYVMEGDISADSSSTDVVTQTFTLAVTGTVDFTAQV